MMMYNRKRRTEFFTVQKQLHEDSLEAARLAYMTGTASAEQIALVEDATAKAKSTGTSMPSILSSPTPANSTTATLPGESLDAISNQAAGGAEQQEPKKGGLTGWLFSGLKKEEDPTTTIASASSSETLGSSDEAWRISPSTATAVSDKAKAAFSQERDNQRRGGPLDQVGLDTTTAAVPAAEGNNKKKGWLW
jgi:hypothetical protein